MHVEFTLTPACPMMCSYCPQIQYVKAYKNLNTTKKFTTIEDFKVMLDNVEHIVQDIFFTGYTEPVLNSNWFEIASYTVQSGYRTHFNTTLVGATIEDVHKMCSLNMKIRVHLTDSKNEIKEDIYKEFLKSYRGQHTFDAFTEKGKNIKCGTTDIIYNDMQSRGGNVEHKDAVQIYHNYPVGCSEGRQYSSVILPNGDVSVCCQDFGLTNIMGNILQNKLRDIHRSDKMKEFTRKMRSNEDSICKKCSYAYKL